MKSPSESGEHNLDNRDFADSSDSSIPDSLKNLFDLLNEFIEEDNHEEKTLLESDVRSTSETQEISSQLNYRSSTEQKSVSSSEDLSEPLIIEAESNTKLPTDIPEKPDSLIESKNIDVVNSQTNLPTNLTANYSDVLKGGKREKIPKNDTTPKASLINFDSVNQQDIDQIYVAQQWIKEKEQQFDELAISVNSLIPLVIQLSTNESKNSQEYILNAIVPIIDRVIQQRSLEDRQKMAGAIADILPSAIQQEISNVPESIGKAIAPEIALSIEEQTKLNEGAIARALGSEMGKAIKNQIEMERDAMVDALYPVIGSTIAKYMSEVVASINEKVDAALSPVGIQRKIRAKLQGVSEAELILRESLPCSIRAIFLIHNNSGLVIQELQPDTESPLESDLLAGMLTAIRSFANDCIAANSELDEIDYGNFKILFETAGYCYLAVVIEGEPIRQFRDRMREIFSQIVLKYGDEIEHYQGDPATIPESIQLLFQELVYQSTRPDYNKPPKALYWLTAVLLGAVMIPCGVIWHRGAVANRIEEEVAVELDATPELSVYRLTPQVRKGKLTLTGRVPSIYLKNLAANVTNQIATEKNLELDNQIVAVNVPVDPTVTNREVARLTKVLNQKSQVIIKTNYQNRTVTIDGLILDPTEQKNTIANFSNIPGVEKVIFIVTQQLPNIKTRIYFPVASSKFSSKSDFAKIEQIKQFLVKYPLIKLKIIGHSDRKGIKDTNLKLARARANNVYQAIIAQGIDPKRLEVIASSKQPPDLLQDRSQPLWLSRCVRFESFLIETN